MLAYRGTPVRKTLFAILLFCVLTPLFFLSAAYRLGSPSFAGHPKILRDFTLQIDKEAPKAITLPTKLEQLDPRTPVALSASFFVKPSDNLFVKSVFAPFEVYVNGSLVFSAGQKDSFPPYLNDPPTMLTMIPLHDYNGEIELRIEYLSLTQRSKLSLPAFLLGSEGAILAEQFRLHGFSFLFSLLLVVLGLMLTVFGLTTMGTTSAGSPFLWLGLFSLSGGIWILGECDLTALLLPVPALLYNMSYLGLFLLAIPLIHFGLVVLNPKNKSILKGMLLTHYVSISLALILQLTGLMDFTRSLYWFHIIVPAGFLVLALTLAFEFFHSHTAMARRFVFAVVLLASSALFELMNYWLGFTDILTLFFQVGLLAFIATLAVISGDYVRNTMLEKTELEYKVAATAHQLELQRQQYRSMAESAASIRNQRHDLRHHLAVIHGLYQSGENQQLETYLETINKHIPPERDVHLSENYAINAVAAHYEAIAEEKGIETELHFAIPSRLEGTLESDLCIVVGNLLENAVEACTRMIKGHRYLQLHSNLEHGMLTLVVENSFTGSIHLKDKAFLSSKRPGVGIGLASVMAITKKYGGGTRYKYQDGVFEITAYLRIAD